MTNQPNICKELITEGWAFRWNAETRRVECVNHSEGYRFHLVEILPVVESVDVNEIGEAIARLFSGVSTTTVQPPADLPLPIDVRTIRSCSPDFLEVGEACKYHACVSGVKEDHAGKAYYVDADSEVWIRIA